MSCSPFNNLKPSLGFSMWSTLSPTLIPATSSKQSSRSWRLVSYVATAVMIIERKLHSYLPLWLEIQVEISYPSSSSPPSVKKPKQRRRLATPATCALPMPLKSARDPKKKALLIGIRKIRNQPILKPLPRLIPKNTHWKRDRPNPRPTEFSQQHRRRSLTFSTNLLIEFNDLEGPHEDVEMIKHLLIDVYGYHPSDIVILIDNDDPEQIQPTRVNILAQIDQLVKDVQPEDKLFFHYSGHGDQQLTNDPSEEDEMDEMIPACDGEFILDNELHDRLIAPLPARSQLTAILDCCHSGSLFDLPHFRCNGVYVPWVNKGTRMTDTILNIMTRKHGLSPSERNDEREGYITNDTTIDQTSTWSLRSIPCRTPVTANTKSDTTSTINSNFSFSSSSSSSSSSSLHADDGTRRTHRPFVRGTPRRKRTITLELSISTIEQAHTVTDRSTWVLEELCMSPEDEYCTGSCALEDFDNSQRATVICLSSAEDADMAWLPESGEGLTKKLCQMLREEHHPTLSRMLTSLAHSMHKIYLNLHTDARVYRKRVSAMNKRREASGMLAIETCPAEMDNFLNPIVSSHVPLDMHNTLWQP